MKKSLLALATLALLAGTAFASNHQEAPGGRNGGVKAAGDVQVYRDGYVATPASR